MPLTGHPGYRFGGRDLLVLALLWLAGANLRITLLAIPPVLPRIVRDLDLGPAGVGALSGLPVLLLSLAAIGGSLLIAKLGARRALVVGLVIVGAGSALRGIGPSIVVLFVMTWVMGVGIAMMQPAMPAVTRAWCPTYVGVATAIYANGLLMGEVFSASLTIPFVLPLLGMSWEWSLVFWSMPALLTAAGVLLFTMEEKPDGSEVPASWWPDWRQGSTWKAGLILSASGSLYFSTNAFIPELLTMRGEADLISAALTALNAGQLPSSVLLAMYASRLDLRRLPIVIAALLAGVGVIGILLTSGWAMIAASALIGAATAFILIWSLSLPALIAPRDEIPRLSAGIFTIGYFCAFLSPLIGGWAWDLSGIPETSLFPSGVLLVVCVIAVSTIRLKAVAPLEAVRHPG